MNTTQRRIALLTGASLATLGLAAPAFAAPFAGVQPYTGVPGTGSYSGTNHTFPPGPAVDAISVCATAVTPAVCYFGEYRTGAGVVSATVNNTVSGQILQYGLNPAGVVDLSITNLAGDTAQIGAVAIASDTILGLASAHANIDTGIEQSVTGASDNVSISIQNNGTLLINTLAIATGINANANGHNDTPIHQFGSSTGGDVMIDVTNTGDLELNSTALAFGGTNADATALVRHGVISQSAYAFLGNGNATVQVSNVALATLHIGAYAFASAPAGSAQASGSIETAIWQYASATGGGNANALVANSGLMEIHSTGIAVGSSYASAQATVDVGISQSAYANGGGNASNIVSNNGVGAVLDITAVASATGTGLLGNAFASASVTSAITQYASATGGGNASNLIANAGAMNIEASARAISFFSSATASAYNSEAINQSAFANAGGSAIDTLNNDVGASLDIGASAVASAGSTAFAYASVSSAIEQYASATGGGNANVALNNSGALNIHASASAVGTEATASAYNERAIDQDAITFGGGNANVSVSNLGVGTIDITAKATAIATDYDAYAYASNYQAFDMTANAHTSGNASVALINDGQINVEASAFASGQTNGAGVGTASAYAYNESAIDMEAFADSGNATVSISGIGGIDIGAKATAISTTDLAYAYASVDDAIYERATVFTAGAALATANFGAGGLNIHATASAQVGSIASASAYNDYGIEQYADNYGSGPATANIVNSGAMVISAVAFASSTKDSANAYASAYYPISQTAYANSGNATVSLLNNGTIDIAASAHAIGNTLADAYAEVYYGIGQYAYAFNGGDASVSLINAPALTIEAHATATGNSATASAYIYGGITQSAFAHGVGGDAAVLLDNGADPLTISADALANADVNDAYAYATVTTGILQVASATLGNANASVLNAGTMSIAAHATANGVTFASASGYVGRGISQSAFAGGGVASVLVDNQNTLNIEAGANAVAADTALAQARVNTGIAQYASGTAGAVAAINNDGLIDVGANAAATAPLLAVASATAYGASQTAVSGTASFVNGAAATYDVHATAFASATAGFAAASAFAYGDFQVGALDVFDNENLFTVFASAVATGAAGSASASVIGMGGYNSFGLTTASIDYLNAGTMNVTALAAAPSTADAYAVGISVGQYGPTSLVAVHEEILQGTIVNNGTLHVLASAAGMGTTVTALGAVVTHSSASAVGILMASGTNNMTVTNTGLISVDAVTGGSGGAGGTATATGILAFDNGDGIAAPAGSLLTITNASGDIIVRESVDGGATWRRGTAIDVAGAPNPTVINLLGGADGGYIYGNIAMQTGDNIFVESGTTYFDGIINPAFMPPGGVTAADLDSGLFGVGTLTIDNGGNLIMADPRITGDPTMYDGPSYAFVNTFNVAADGTITFELQPAAGGTQPVGTYPQIFTDVANLDGTLVANITTAGGLFADNYFWDNVIDANVRNGGFDGSKCVIDGAYSGSLLLSLDCIEDANNNIDLSLTRTAFNAVPGLNDNGTQVGSGLECIYDPALTGGIASLLGDLFLFTDPVNYNIALNNLAGEGYANYLQSMPSLGVHYNDLVDHATNCEVPALAGSILECRASAPFHLWGQLDYQWRKADGDSEAGRAKARRFTGLIGVDANVGNAAIVGIEGGYVTNHTRTNRFNERVDGNGWQVGAYGAYDPGQFYVKAMATYSWFNGDSSRTVDFTGLAPGATFKGSLRASPDANMWTFGLHGGYRIGMGGNSVITPYVNYDYVNAKLKSFTETGLAGANLTVLGGRSKHSFLTGGIKWATQVGGVVPEVNLGYRYRFGKRVSEFNAAFIGDTSCDFEVDSAAQKRGSFLAGLSVGGKMGPVDLRIGYEGEFNSNITSHSGNFKIVLPLGGHAAPPPPPPPPVMAPPPPPPPPVEVAPPPPPPPPPAPVERGERGQ